jgi:plastocyanin
MGVLAVAAVLALAGCGSDNSSTSSGGGSGNSGSSASSGGGGEQLQLAADPGGGLSFDKKTLTAKAGTVTIDFTNDSSTAHAVAVEGNGIDKDGKTVTQGKDSLTVTLKKGTYEFYCPVDGHRQAGMEGKLTVQ